MIEHVSCLVRGHVSNASDPFAKQKAKDTVHIVLLGRILYGGDNSWRLASSITEGKAQPYEEAILPVLSLPLKPETIWAFLEQWEACPQAKATVPGGEWLTFIVMDAGWQTLTGTPFAWKQRQAPKDEKAGGKQH